MDFDKRAAYDNNVAWAELGRLCRYVRSSGVELAVRRARRGVYLELIRVREDLRRQRRGSQAMMQLCRWADLAGQEVNLLIKRGYSDLSEANLCSFYEKYGFLRDSLAENVLSRKPSDRSLAGCETHCLGKQANASATVRLLAELPEHAAN